MSIFGTAFGLAFGVGMWFTADALRHVDWKAGHRWWANLLGMETETLSWLVAGALAGAVLGSAVRDSGGAVVGAAVGGGAAIYGLRQRDTQRRQRLAIERSLVTPAFLDMLAISMATGAGLRSSLTSLLPKVEPLVQDLWEPVTVTAEVGLVEQLQAVARNTDHSPTQRIANALIVSTERGTPIVDLLQNLAQEVRAESRRQLLEIAAKKDVQMMLPVVFGILPSITVIALYPAVGSLTSLA